ncbi:serine/threonine-protein kinase [Marinicellulosiphila megalodicopiae]|uniref:serine/threonine-protein kinase n=1 Tax=Marinicellulosiphila megalodicopiae TaxID=2724896 RepID=UPI003BAEFD69
MEDYNQHLSKQGFKLSEIIGRGLSGKTYLATQPSLNRNVAIKFYDSPLNKNNPSLKKKFKREAFLLASTQHPSIPYVITHGDVITDNNSIPYIVMEYIEGHDLEKYIKEKGRLEQQEVIPIAIQILDALSSIHLKEIIHRDIKPSNIMLTKNGHAYLIDFSIGFSTLGQTDLTRNTSTRDHLGTIDYMPPEQRRSMKYVDKRSDLYSLGMTLCKLLTGSINLKDLDKPLFSIPFALRKCINKACEQNADDRFNNAEDMYHELKSIIGANYYANETPRLALCNSLNCPDANWSENGYLRGANFIKDCSDIHCTSCGTKLVYQCTCGYSIANTPCCGGCGADLFKLPKCKSCDSFLKKIDFDKDTSKGCTKCLQPQPIQQPQPLINQDEDIPF